MTTLTRQPQPTMSSGPMRAHCIRLRRGADLMKSLLDAAEGAMEASGNSSAAFVLSAVGSVSAVKLRLAKASRSEGLEVNDIREWNEKLEVVSLVGTFGPSRQKHLHLSVANGDGVTFGGHLLAGTIFTTLELVIGTIENLSFGREIDKETGYSELAVQHKTTR